MAFDYSAGNPSTTGGESPWNNVIHIGPSAPHSTPTFTGKTCNECGMFVLYPENHVCPKAMIPGQPSVTVRIAVEVDEEKLDRVIAKLERIAELTRELRQ